MGFADRRKRPPEPDGKWEFLLALAMLDGELDWESDFADRLMIMLEVDRNQAPRMVNDLCRRLEAYFEGIPGRPFHHYNRFNAYRTKFRLRCSDNYSQRLQSGEGLDDLLNDIS